MELSRTFSDRSNCRKAAMRALGDNAFKVHKVDGGFAFEAISLEPADLPPSRFADVKPTRADDIPAGLKRLRASKNADALRAEALAEAKEAREELAEKIATQKPAKPAARLAVLEDNLNSMMNPIYKAPKAPKPAPAAEAEDDLPKISKSGYDLPTKGMFGAIYEAARKGIIPETPDFSALTHKPYRKRLAEAVALVEAGDSLGLWNFPIDPVASSRRTIWRYCQYAAIAIEAKAARKGGH